MSVQYLDRTLHAYRIGDPDGEYPIFDATGSTIAPGRWNDAYTPVIYTAEHYSTAMLEKLVQLNGVMPANQHFVEIVFPKGLSYIQVTKDTLPGWAGVDQRVASEYGVSWARKRASALLIAPSYVARMEHNIIINPHHLQFPEIEHTLAEPIWWDDRLFVS